MKRHPALVPLSHDHHHALIDGEEPELARGHSAIVAKGRRRKITAGPNGVRYLSIHRRPPPLQIGRAALGRASGPAPSEA